MYKAEVSMLNRPPVKRVTILPQMYFGGGGGGGIQFSACPSLKC